MSKIIPCLWFESDAEEAVTFYVSLLPDSKIDHVLHSPIDTPSGPAGHVLTVEFTLAGLRYLAINGGGPGFTDAVSFQILCDDQSEVDRLWNALLSNGGTELECGWLRDRWGLSWQITPRRLMELLKQPSAARPAMEAMMKMVKIDMAALDAAVTKG